MNYKINYTDKMEEWNCGGFDWLKLLFIITLPLVLYCLEKLI